MSSSYRSSLNLRAGVTSVIVLAGLAGIPSGATRAADTYVQPKMDLRVEVNDNFDMDPDGGSGSDVYGYIADLQALVGIATPRSDTSLRPRVRFQQYPDRDDVEELEAFLDVRSQYEWERSRFLVFGRYARQDTYNTEFTSGEFDPLDPNDPGLSEAGTAQVGETRTRYQLQPELTFDVTERVQVGASADLQSVRYDSDGVEQFVDYDYWNGEGFVTWALDQRSDISVAGYASKYEARDDSHESDGVGGEIGYRYRWSESIGAEFYVLYEQDDSTDFVPVRVEESTSGWGGTVVGYYKGEVSEWRLSAGRSYIPTGSGGRNESDQFRLQYDRDITQRLAFNGAARYESRMALSESNSGNDRDYARVDMSLKWMITPTWYVQGGYNYIWQDREADDGDASNNRIFISGGYKGLGRQGR